LLAIILRTGARGKNVLELAGELLRRFGRGDIAKACFSELRAAPGLGPARSCEILAAFELGRRFLNGKKAGIYLKPRDIWEELRDIRDQKKEHFVVFYLDTRNQEIKREIVSIGTLNYNLVHPREVFEPAVKNLAASVIVAHNHPAGCLEPSDEDLSRTKRLVQAGKVLGRIVHRGKHKSSQFPIYQADLLKLEDGMDILLTFWLRSPRPRCYVWRNLTARLKRYLKLKASGKVK